MIYFFPFILKGLGEVYLLINYRIRMRLHRLILDWQAAHTVLRKVFLLKLGKTLCHITHYQNKRCPNNWYTQIYAWTQISLCKQTIPIANNADPTGRTRNFITRIAISGGSRNFKTGGGGSRRGRIFRPGVCFDAPSHILYVFLAWARAGPRSAFGNRNIIFMVFLSSENYRAHKNRNIWSCVLMT